MIKEARPGVSKKSKENSYNHLNPLLQEAAAPASTANFLAIRS
jgi:hypothetical protein